MSACTDARLPNAALGQSKNQVTECSHFLPLFLESARLHRCASSPPPALN